MAKKSRTHTLTLLGKHVYPMADIENRSLPELAATVVYDGEDEEGTHFFTGNVKIKYGSDRLHSELSQKLHGLLNKKHVISGRGFATTHRAAIDWGDQLIAEFLQSGLFSIAVLDASGSESGNRKGPVYEYEPVLQVVKAEVYKV